jgi:ssDNA-binding Zn-finger/Zn-ribbon topoisomerase 1
VVIGGWRAFWLIDILRFIEKSLEKSYGICPNCGGKLVMRKGKYGKFLGCNKYPRCKYTQNIS